VGRPPRSALALTFGCERLGKLTAGQGRPRPALRRPWPLWLTVPLLVFGAGCAGTGASTAPSVAAVPSLVEARAQRGGKLAIVIDVDETALSNLPSLRANDYGFIVAGPCDLPREPCGLGAWIGMARAEPIRPVLALARLARDRGVDVFFLTGRPERLRAATEANLRAAGFEWTRLILKPDDLTTKSAADFKAPERKKLQDQGYTIIVNIGDQMSDLDGGFAERTYKLPNPFYFIP